MVLSQKNEAAEAKAIVERDAIDKPATEEVEAQKKEVVQGDGIDKVIGKSEVVQKDEGDKAAAVDAHKEEVEGIQKTKVVQKDRGKSIDKAAEVEGHMEEVVQKDEGGCIDEQIVEVVEKTKVVQKCVSIDKQEVEGIEKKMEVVGEGIDEKEIEVIKRKGSGRCRKRKRKWKRKEKKTVVDKQVAEVIENGEAVGEGIDKKEVAVIEKRELVQKDQSEGIDKQEEVEAIVKMKVVQKNEAETNQKGSGEEEQGIIKLEGEGTKANTKRQRCRKRQKLLKEEEPKQKLQYGEEKEEGGDNIIKKQVGEAIVERQEVEVDQKHGAINKTEKFEAIEKMNLVQKDEDGGNDNQEGQSNHKQEEESSRKQEGKGTTVKKKWKGKKKRKMLLEEANHNQQENEKAEEGQAGDIKQKGEAGVEKQEGEAIGKHGAQVNQKEGETLKDWEPDEKHEPEAIYKTEVEIIEKRNLAQKDWPEGINKQDEEGNQMPVEITNQKQEGEATKVKKIKFPRLQKSKIMLAELRLAEQKWQEANQNQQDEEKNNKEHDGQEAEATNAKNQDRKAIIEKVGGDATRKQREKVNHKRGEATKVNKNKPGQKNREKVKKARIEKQEGEGAIPKKHKGKAIKEMQQKEEPDGQVDYSQIDAATRHKIISALHQFSTSDDKEYTFDANLTKCERGAVHLLCRKMGMMSKSSGRGDDRRISVYKRRMSGRQKNEESHKKEKILTRFTFSEEAKDVSLNLFTLYPPFDCELGDNMAGRSVVKTNNRRRKVDPSSYFARPLMSKLDIRKVVESLASKVANDPKLKQITEKRSKLPIASFRDAITSTINFHQVVLISGETGCGKTTQVPQYVLDYVWGKGETCKIICTQPRRISAVSVAVRISSERGEKIGDSVGYKIKLESEGGRNSSIIFCTTGVLLRILVAQGGNSSEREASRNRDDVVGPDGITHIIVDEVHERDQFSDLLLAIIRDLLPSHPNIRLVMMSATIDAERFSQYFGGCPIIRVPGFTYPVKSFYLEDILSILKSNENNHLDCASRIVTSERYLLSEEYRAVIDDTINLAWSSDEYEPLLGLVSSGGPNIFNFQHSSTGVTPLMVFARKGRVGELSMILSLGADFHLLDNDGATALEWAKRENQKEAAEILKKHMEKSVVNNVEDDRLLDTYLATVNSELVDVVLIEKLLMKICTDSTDGAILVFLTGWDDIKKAMENLQRSSFFKDPSKFLLLILHSSIPSLEQNKVFGRPPPGCRKIILSTNIAESSITIDDVVYVIDSGRMKEKSYDPYNNVSTLLSSWISKASLKQREGRAGRCQAGICYHLYSKTRAASFLDFQVPAVKRMPLEELCLQVKLLDPVCKISDFLGKLLDPPLTQSIHNGISVLKEIGALSPDEELTELGEKIGSLPVHPIISKMLFFSILLNCLDPALTLACVLGNRDLFVIPMSPIEKKRAGAAKQELASLYGGHGDQLAVIAAYECWKKAEEGHGSSFCSRYFVSPGTMKMLSRMRKQLKSELHRKGFIPEDDTCCNLNAHDPGIRDAVLVSGFYPLVGRLQLPRKGMRTVVETATGEKVRLNPRSANFMLSSKNSADQPLVVFDEITCGDRGSQIMNCSVIGPLPLMLLAKEIIVAPFEEDGDNNGGTKSECPDKDTVDDCEVDKHKDSPIKGESIMSIPGNKVKVVVDRWLTFESTALDVAQIYCLRERLSAAILFKIRNPWETPQIFDASLRSIARILSYDGISGIPSTLKYASPRTSVAIASETGQSVQGCTFHHGSKASKSTEMANNHDQPAYCSQHPPPLILMNTNLGCSPQNNFAPVHRPGRYKEITPRKKSLKRKRKKRN